MKQFTYLFISLILLSFSVFAATESDYAKEKRWANQVEDSLLDGDAVWLSSNNHKFLTIFTESETESQKAAIIIHGIGAHPDWQQVVQPLRVSLTQYGYHTLSIQMPILANGVAGKEYLPLFPKGDARIKAAVEFLNKKGMKVNLLVAHSLGSSMALHFLANNNNSFSHFIGIGMNFGSLQYLEKLTIPILDLYGTDDIGPVLDSVAKRKLASKNNSKYTQVQVKADHFFSNNDELLIETVTNWLK